MVTCSACGKPLCPDCMVFSAVGIKCRECAKMPRSALVTLKRGRLLRAVAAGLGAGTAVGFAYYYILGSIGFFFFFFFVAAGIGYLVGEAVRRASGHYHGTADGGGGGALHGLGLRLPPGDPGLLEHRRQLERGGLHPVQPRGDQLGGHGRRRLPGLVAEPLRSSAPAHRAGRLGTLMQRVPTGRCTSGRFSAIILCRMNQEV